MVFVFHCRYLIKFLSKLAENQDVNKMSPSNIAIVMGPNLLWAPASDGGYKIYTFVFIKNHNIVVCQTDGASRTLLLIIWLLTISTLYSIIWHNLKRSHPWGLQVHTTHCLGLWQCKSPTKRKMINCCIPWKYTKFKIDLHMYTEMLELRN